MTQEEKELLLKDLSARLLYGVIINIPHIYSDKFKAYQDGKTGKDRSCSYKH